MHDMDKFKYIDLFSGIGGFHQAMEQLGGECILSSEIDSYAIDVYRDNYKEESGINIRDINEKDIPDFDVLCAGFPCQTFSKIKYLGFFSSNILSISKKSVPFVSSLNPSCFPALEKD